ncbi:MAG TPA: hypothetical protein VFT95_18515, partial [Micromonosporaceae bacterium]|nr:hypothetical protein [Micromonosporaceae bacterium]
MKRLVRRLWPGRGALVRRVDRAEAVLRLVVLVAAIVLVPIALTLGSETYAGQVHAGEEQRQARHQVAATLLQDAPGASMGAGGESPGNRSGVRVRWTLADGAERTGTVPAADGLHAGATITIWLDEAGDPVT